MFNENSKKKNILLSSSIGVIEQIIVYVSQFIFRTIFLMVLTKEYLGITGLFSNVLQIFSLAELGIGGVIGYRLYKPVKENDIEKCAQLLRFYKHVYYIIALIVFFIGCIYFPFISFTIADINEVPADININLIYWLFVIQNVSSYFCVYVQSLLSADQKNYVLSFGNCIYILCSYIFKIIFLFIFRNYTIVLSTGIVINILYNIIIASYIKRKYKTVFNSKTNNIIREEKIQIFKDTGAMMCHKVGYVIVNGTDSIILSKFIGIGVLGLYSNYQMISVAIDAVLGKMLGSFVSTIGNFSVDATSDEKYNIYKPLLFLNMWIASFCSICYFVLIEPFITIWLGQDFLLSTSVAIIISLNIFFNSSRIISGSFVSAVGMFVKDKVRPLIQALLNLIISIVLVIKIGIVGIFIGTLLSSLLTVWWREGYLLYKNLFNKNVFNYYLYYLFWFLITIIVSLLFWWICKFIPVTIWGVVLQFIICIFGINIFYCIIFWKNKNFQFFKNLLISKIKRRNSK
ncbi:MAG: oligosaccharide flippase family protein [Treponema sp.]|nr:oligosaccharide flippase family protein [Treponema sp.]